MTPRIDELEVAVRGWFSTPGGNNRRRRQRPGTWIGPGPSEWVLVFDTETTTDEVQRLRFGTFQAYKSGRLRRQGVFYDPDGLTGVEVDRLKQIATDRGWEVITVDRWIEDVFFALAVDLAATVVGHNLFFDLTRVAIGHDTTRSRDPRMRGGFSLKLAEDDRRPRVLVKRASPSATFIQFTVPASRSPEQRSREKGADTAPFRGFFVDTSASPPPCSADGGRCVVSPTPSAPNIASSKPTSTARSTSSWSITP